jgi:hypothetical protein
MVKYRRQGIGSAFLDVVFNLSLGLTLMFFLALILMNPIAKDNEVELKAEFIITMDWPEEINSDIDLWTLDPGNRAVGYSQKENGPTALERDDLGNNTDSFIYDEDGEVIRIAENHEIITVRAIVPGDWTVNVFYYQAKGPTYSGTGNGRGGYAQVPEIPKIKQKIPVEVTVTVTKINPKVEVISVSKAILNDQGEERTMVRFHVDEKGDITMKGNDPIKFVQSVPDDNNGWGP